MAAFVKTCDRYAAFLYPNGKSEGRINLYCADGYKLYLIFSAGTTFPTNDYGVATKTGVAHEDIERYSDYLDMVRNEKPVRVTFNPENKNFVVYVSGEEVGEGEI